MIVVQHCLALNNQVSPLYLLRIVAENHQSINNKRKVWPCGLQEAGRASVMDRTQLLLVALPLFLLISDLFNLFTPPSKPDHNHHHHHDSPLTKPHAEAIQQPPFDFSPQKPGVDAIGLGNTVSIDFCASCSYRGTAVTMKNMLETQFPGIHVVLANYPPPLPKRVLSKLVPVTQVGVMSLIFFGDHIFPRLGYAVPPPWFHSLRANRFGTISSTWLLGNLLQSFLQSSGAFEVYCNGEPVFSKLKTDRFPGEIELKNLISQKIVSPRVVDDFGGAHWS